jgi:hypothetical protein
MMAVMVRYMPAIGSRSTMKVLDATDLLAPEEVSRALVRDILLIAFANNDLALLNEHDGVILGLSVSGEHFEWPFVPMLMPNVLAEVRSLTGTDNVQSPAGCFSMLFPDRRSRLKSLNK